MEPIKAQLPSGPDAAALRLQDQMKKSAEATAAITKEKAEKDKVTTEDKTYYSGVDGSRYYFKNGDAASFTNGLYVTNKPSEIDELEELCDAKGQYLITRDPQTVRHSDAKLLKEVATGQGGQVSGGMVNSSHLGLLPR